MTLLCTLVHFGTRRVAALLLGVVLIAVSCGGSEAASEPTNQDSTTPIEAPSVLATPPPQPTAEPAVTAAPEPTPDSAPPPTSEPEPTPEPTAAVEQPSLFVERGPYAVGVATYSLEDRDVEVWYPVEPSSVQGDPTEVFDTLSVFPENLQAIVPPELSGDYDTLAIRDAPALANGFPVVIYGHGFGGYRQIATNFTSHLASWGMVVASADHLERGIAEQTLDLVGAGLFDESNVRPDAAVDDVRNTITLLGELNDEGPLARAMDLDRLAISGHSAGAFAAIQAVSEEPDLIDGWISISGGTRDGLEPPHPGLVVIGELDAVVSAERSYELYETQGASRVVLNVAGAGHNSFTDPCRGILDLGGLGTLTALLGAEQVARAEDGCTPGSTDPETVQAVVSHVSVAWLNELFGVTVGGDPLSSDVVAAIAPLIDYEIR